MKSPPPHVGRTPNTASGPTSVHRVRPRLLTSHIACAGLLFIAHVCDVFHSTISASSDIAQPSATRASGRGRRTHPRGSGTVSTTARCDCACSRQLVHMATPAHRPRSMFQRRVSSSASSAHRERPSASSCSLSGTSDSTVQLNFNCRCAQRAACGRTEVGRGLTSKFYSDSAQSAA